MASVRLFHFRGTKEQIEEFQNKNNIPVKNVASISNESGDQWVLWYWTIGIIQHNAGEDDRCEAITYHGTRCMHAATIKGLCLPHWRSEHEGKIIKRVTR